jgi:hypothetical protein
LLLPREVTFDNVATVFETTEDIDDDVVSGDLINLIFKHIKIYKDFSFIVHIILKQIYILLTFLFLI